MVAFWEGDAVVLEEETIWAFCFITSAGVRMAQETSSAKEEAEAWIRGRGRIVVLEEVVFQAVKRHFVCS